ncbi:hypothetical protein VH441_09485 [Psychrobacter sp. HD31]|uniref:hypothetical protein n=1 Tax=Psychrobacter sp. HD31 TaxID=3112003 RepID=UPI003DA36000
MKALSVKAMMAAMVIGLAGCASTGNITPQYISPSNYASYDCFTLNQEYQRVNQYIEGTQNQVNRLKASGVRIGLAGSSHRIYPTVSFGLGSDGSNDARKTKLSHLFGESDAIIQAARMKGCSFAEDIKIYGEE